MGLGFDKVEGPDMVAPLRFSRVHQASLSYRRCHGFCCFMGT